MTDNQEYSLGKEVTKMARGRGAKTTTVVSVRLSTEEVTRLEALSEETGKSISEIVREALDQYKPSGDSRDVELIIGIAGGSALGYGRSQITEGNIATTEGLADLVHL